MGADDSLMDLDLTKAISIHGPRVGADYTFDRDSERLEISIHGPRVGADKKRLMPFSR